MTTTEYRDPLARCEIPAGHETQPYFVEKARAALDGLYGEDVPHEALAAWAESVRNRGGDKPDGVLVATDGTLLAETYNAEVGPDGMRAYYADGADLTAHGVDAPLDRIVDAACSDLTWATGMAVAHVKASSVTHGASRRALHKNWALNRVQAATRKRAAATDASDQAEAEWRTAILEALAEGATQESVAKNAGVGRGRIGQIEKEGAR